MKQKEFEKRWKESIEQFVGAEEQKCGGWQSGEGLSEKSRRELMQRIAAEEKTVTSYRTVRLRKRYLLVLAAALILALGMGAAGSRVWISGSRDIERETEISTKVDNEEKTDILLEEEAMYREIGEKLGIAPLRLGYLPKGMVFDRYMIGENMGWSTVYYLYEENLISVRMAKQSSESAGNLQWDGESRELDVDSKFFDVEAYCIDEKEHNYGANIAYGNGYYAVFGKFADEQEFVRMLEKIYF